MYYIQEITHFVQPEGIQLFLELSSDLWDTWLEQQEGVVRKENWISTNPQTSIVKCIVTWYGSEFAQAVDQGQVGALKQEIQDQMSNAGYAFTTLKEDTFFSKTTIENGMPDNDDDQDDNDDTTGMDAGGAIIPDDNDELDDDELEENITTISNLGMNDSDADIEDLQKMIEEMQKKMEMLTPSA